MATKPVRLNRQHVWRENRIGIGYIFQWSPEWLVLPNKRGLDPEKYHAAAYDRQYCLFASKEEDDP